MQTRSPQAALSTLERLAGSYRPIRGVPKSFVIAKMGEGFRFGVDDHYRRRHHTGGDIRAAL